MVGPVEHKSTPPSKDHRGEKTREFTYTMFLWTWRVNKFYKYILRNWTPWYDWVLTANPNLQEKIFCFCCCYCILLNNEIMSLGFLIFLSAEWMYNPLSWPHLRSWFGTLVVIVDFSSKSSVVHLCFYLIVFEFAIEILAIINSLS